MTRGWCIAAFSFNAWAQLIPSGAALPRTSKPPVVFINGHQNFCPASFSDTFGLADQVLQSNGEVSLFFNTCSLLPTASIEDLGGALGSFLLGLRYTDGQAVDLVDVVAHSMGGLVLRSYLSGKQNAGGAFRPPAVTHVRKVIFLATPHFGTGVALLFGFTAQVQELASGSRFLFDLATWNQGTDDLRGVDAVAAAGNGGSGLAVTPGFDDGIVALSSASLRFYLPGRTRIVPFCHVGTGGLVGFAGLCTPNAQAIANIQSPAHASARIMVSFLNGTDDWKSVGAAAEDDSFLSVNGGLIATAHTSDDSGVKLNSVTAARAFVTKQLNIPSGDVAYTDLFSAGVLSLTATAGSFTANSSVTLPSGGTRAYVVKPGPSIAGVLPAAASVFPLSVAPGMLVAIYGTSLASGAGDTQALIDGSPISTYYTSATQINAVIPDNTAGLVKLTVRNNTGNNMVNLLVEPAVPALFTQDSSGTGAASALHASDSRLVTAANPLHAGEAVELFATGLGATTLRSGLQYADRQPTVTISGANCAVTFAGRAPGFIGLDQINCTVPAGLGANASAAVIVTSGNRASNVATLAIE